MEDLRQKKQQSDRKNKIFKLKALIYWKKYKYKILIGVIVGVILFFPEASGQYIGQFITDFLGNIIKYINL